MLVVSSAYVAGTDCERSLASSMHYLEKAARAGNPEAMRRYSDHLIYGPFFMFPTDVHKSMREEAASWLVKSAEAGNFMSMAALSMEYEGGGMLSRVGRDRNKAFEWCKKAAASGLPGPIARLSRFYRFGVGCEKNEKVADGLLEEAKKAAKGIEQTITFLEVQSRSNPLETTVPPPQSESGEPDADQSARVATPKSNRSPRRDEAKPQDDPQEPGLTVAILEQAGGHTKFGGMLPNYQVVAMVRNTSSQPLKMLTMTVILRRADNSLIGTEARMADVRNIEPGDTSTIKMDTGEKLDEIDHYDLKFTAGFPDERNVNFTIERPDRPPPRSKAPTRRRWP